MPSGIVMSPPRAPGGHEPIQTAETVVLRSPFI
jgi:hypothetical protein